MSRQFNDFYFSMSDEEREEYDAESEAWEMAEEMIERNNRSRNQSDYKEDGMLSYLKKDRYGDVPEYDEQVEMLFADDCHRTKCERCHREVIFSNKNIYPGIIKGRYVVRDPYIICPYCLWKNEKLGFLPKNKRFYTHIYN